MNLHAASFSAQPHRFMAACNGTLHRARARGRLAILIATLTLAGCPRAEEPCDRCDLMVVAATGEPTTLVPPLIREAVGRDITDFVFERLADLKTGGIPSDTAAYLPGLATRWERVDSLTWRFTLRAGAAWHDGTPVTAEDVLFSFAAFVDPALGAPAAGALGEVTVTSGAAGRVTVRFPRPYPEQLLDATFQVRILPKHVWNAIPRADWAADTGLARLVGSGPFKVTEWQRGRFLRIERVGDPKGNLREIVWRFAGDQDAALNLALSGEADLLETVTNPAARERAQQDSGLILRPYPSAVYGYLGFRHHDEAGLPHPVLSDAALRRALAAAIDRAAVVKAVLGPEAAVPEGPMSRALWLWRDQPVAGADTAAASRLLDSLGWTRGSGQVRARGGRRLTVDILVPATSGVRRALAQGIQEMWRTIGIDATVTAVDFPVFQERLQQGKFDAMIGAWLDEPSPRGLAEAWGRSGWGQRNQGRYANPTFDSLAAVAMAAPTVDRARSAWHAAIDRLNRDAAAVFLYTPTSVAVMTDRVASLPIDPFSWLSQARNWRMPR
ncbi:MAG: ABC transporter substrate-binding protein [Gemmatimonadales bacterium]